MSSVCVWGEGGGRMTNLLQMMSPSECYVYAYVHWLCDMCLKYLPF